MDERIEHGEMLLYRTTTRQQGYGTHISFASEESRFELSANLLKSLVALCPQLTEFNLTWEYDDVTVLHILKQLPLLLKLKLFHNTYGTSNRGTSDAVMTGIAQSCPQLTSLKVCRLSGDDVLIDFVMKLGAKLTVLSVQHSPALTDRSMLVVSKQCCQLNTLISRGKSYF